MRLSLLVLVLASCSRETPTPPASARNDRDAPSASVIASATPSFVPDAKVNEKKPIGQATMKSDRTIVLDLFVPAHLRESYPPNHPKYAKILAHVGPLEPGEQKLVMPWPDDIDDEKVEAAVHAWAAQQKWDKASYRFEIVGTDKDQNVAVSVTRGGRLDQLILSPKSYAVVKAVSVR